MIVNFKIFFLKKVLKSRFLLRCMAPLIMMKIGTAHLEMDSKKFATSQLCELTDREVKYGAVQCIRITKNIAIGLNKSK